MDLLLHQREIIVSHEAIRAWCYKFGSDLARCIRRKRRQLSDILMQPRNNTKATKRFFEVALGKTDTLPRVIATDDLRSYNIISRKILAGVEHQRSKYLNNRAENSHQPTRRRERRIQRFKSFDQAQIFLSIFDIIYRYFHPPQNRLTTDIYRK